MGIAHLNRPGQIVFSKDGIEGTQKFRAIGVGVDKGQFITTIGVTTIGCTKNSTYFRRNN